MGNYTYRIWPELPYTQIPSYLEYMEDKGLRFEGLAFGDMMGKFRRAAPNRARYDWDYVNSRQSDQPEKQLLDFQEFYEQQGWELLWHGGDFKVLRALEHANPAPVHCGGTQGQEVIRKLTKGSMQIGTVIVGALMVWLWAWFWKEGSFPVMVGYQQLSNLAILVLGGFYGVVSVAWGWWDRKNSGEVRWCRFPAILFGIGVFFQINQVLLFGFLAVDAQIEGHYMFLGGLFLLFGLGQMGFFREMYGMGGKAASMGIKHLPRSRRLLGACLIALGVGIAVVGYGHVPVETEQEVRGQNLYCTVVYRESGEHLWADAYYFAKSEGAARKIIGFYEKEEKKYGGQWEKVETPDTAASLEPVGPYAVAPEAEIYRLSFWGGSPEPQHYLYLARRGTEIWFTRYQTEGNK